MSPFSLPRKERWRALAAAVLRAWLPTWRFYDSPDYTLEIRIDLQEPWQALSVAEPFRWWKLGLNPALVDRMWCEARIRHYLDLANETAFLDSRAFESLEGLLQRILGPARPLQGRRWSLRSRDAFDASTVMELHAPPARGLRI